MTGVEILLAFLFGAAIGAAVHALLPHRETRGIALAPVLGALVGGAVWMLLTWAGWTLDNPLLWLASIAAPVAVTLTAVGILTRMRVAQDRRERVRLKIV